MKIWIDRSHVDHLILIHPKSGDTMLKADRAQNYKFMDSMNPVHIIQENTAISLFVFEYFAQKHGKAY